jgi:predicted CxxxxCH...CXXCH cytochrome family protein
VPGNPVISGLHGDGAVDVVFDTTRVTPEASYDPTAGQCAVSCHDLGGAKPRPVWSDPAPATCNDCHGSPPADHFPGPCSECHKEANADGTALSGGPLHMNGKVDLGDGSGGCGACHGSGADPWPSTAAHPSHKTPTLTLPIDCASCHPVPSEVLAPGHLDGVVNVVFTEHAVDRNQSPTWDAPSASCRGVACHGAGLIEPVAAPVWTDASGRAGVCGACHGIPPTEQHTASTDCQRSTCHGTEITGTTTGPVISPSGKALHVNGVIDVQ